MEKPLVWVTGAGGLIGDYLVQTAPGIAPAWNVRPLTRMELDLRDATAVSAAFRREQPGAIIHCAAMSKTPECQANPDAAREINVEVTARLAERAARIPFFFLSTDLVFDGRRGNYSETDAVAPLSVYGETKVAAEAIVIANPRHTVIRTSLNGGVSPTGDRGFNEALRKQWAAGQSTRLFNDEFRAPMSAKVTACALWELLNNGAAGLFHLAGSERLSRWQIGKLVAARCPELKPQIESASIKNLAGALRPADTTLNCAKVQSKLSFKLPGLTEWLAANPSEPF